MAIAFLNSTALTFGTAASTWSIPTHSSRVGGAAFVVGIGVASSAVTVSAMTDNSGHTYTLAVARGTPRPVAGAELWYATNLSSGSTRVSVTLSGNSSGSMAIAQFTGISTANALLETGSSATTANSTVHGASEFTPSTANSVVVWYARATASTISPVAADGGFTLWTSTLDSVRQLGGYLIQGAASTVSGQWRSGAGSTGPCQHAEVMAAFSDTAAPPPPLAFAGWCGLLGVGM